MAYKSRTVSRLFIDIESVALPNAEDLLPEPKAPGNLKDPEKIEAAMELKRQEMLDKAPLDSDLAMVKLVVMSIRVDGPPVVLLIPAKMPTKTTKVKYIDRIKLFVQSSLAPDNEDIHPLAEALDLRIVSERDAIETVWQYLNLCNGASVSYNGMGFDFPFLMKRSMDLGIAPGITVSLAKYRAEPTTDLMYLLANWAWGETKKLKWLAKRYDLEILAEEADGSKVADMSDDELVLYGLSDLHLLRQLYQRMNNVYFSHLEN